MTRFTKLTAAALGLTLLGGAAFADGHIDAAIKARQAQMQLYGFNLGVLGAMAKGDVDYDAATASAAADNLLAAATLNASIMWPQGSDSGAAKSRAKADMWSNYPDVQAKGMALVEAATAMQAAAGGGVEGIRGAIGAVGGACGACHKAYREPSS
ncbi:c-type cytochrome [Shimia abyssi]|uniref:Cytochrome c556 n=1 Tax=Shimia abyssi TaxID=1662395 RepID=A0A2P8F6K6_9RHOB|nr:cytochrome c [Shimia abyssi]PSL17354.1 cytochrome c556 [Shimia abyssi]